MLSFFKGKEKKESETSLKVNVELVDGTNVDWDISRDTTIGELCDLMLEKYNLQKRHLFAIFAKKQFSKPEKQRGEDFPFEVVLEGDSLVEDEQARFSDPQNDLFEFKFLFKRRIILLEEVVTDKAKYKKVRNSDFDFVYMQVLRDYDTGNYPVTPEDASAIAARQALIVAATEKNEDIEELLPKFIPKSLRSQQSAREWDTAIADELRELAKEPAYKRKPYWLKIEILSMLSERFTVKIGNTSVRYVGSTFYRVWEIVTVHPFRSIRSWCAKKKEFMFVADVSKEDMDGTKFTFTAYPKGAKDISDHMKDVMELIVCSRANDFSNFQYQAATKLRNEDIPRNIYMPKPPKEDEF